MAVITLSDVKLPIEQGEEYLRKLAEKKLGGKAAYFKIKKKSLDARDKNNIRYVYTIEFSKEKQEEDHHYRSSRIRIGRTRCSHSHT